MCQEDARRNERIDLASSPLRKARGFKSRLESDIKTAARSKREKAERIGPRLENINRPVRDPVHRHPVCVSERKRTNNLSKSLRN
jgi:hypothetical protein